MDRAIITNYIEIKEHAVRFMHHDAFYYRGEAAFTDFTKNLYQMHKIDYPKFYKMDNLCKLAFIASELLIKENNFRERYQDEEIGIILENYSSSIDSDSKHAESFRDKSNYFPSPSVFVYTLPNIAIGEICIRNSIKGENALFVFEEFDVDFSFNYISTLLQTKRIETAIGGWIEYSPAGYQTFMFLVENDNKVAQRNKSIPFSSEELRRIYLNN